MPALPRALSAPVDGAHKPAMGPVSEPSPGPRPRQAEIVRSGHPCGASGRARLYTRTIRRQTSSARGDGVARLALRSGGAVRLRDRLPRAPDRMALGRAARKIRGQLGDDLTRGLDPPDSIDGFARVERHRDHVTSSLSRWRQRHEPRELLVTNHSTTGRSSCSAASTAERRTRCGALGQPISKRSVRTVSCREAAMSILT